MTSVVVVASTLGTPTERSAAMGNTEPVTELDARYSDEGAEATTWADGRDRVAAATLWWLTTVRPDGRPHVTPLLAVWLEDTLFFCTGPTERKARNLANSSHCVMTTGCNAYDEGFDLVLEGDALAGGRRREAADGRCRLRGQVRARLALRGP